MRTRHSRKQEAPRPETERLSCAQDAALLGNGGGAEGVEREWGKKGENARLIKRTAAVKTV